MSIVLNTSSSTSKNELLRWINENFKLTLTHLEQLGNGSTFCQIFEYLYPNSIQSNKIVWKATTEVECIKNFKTLADAFQKFKIQKQFDIQTLAKGKYQDILDLAQFLKYTFDKFSQKRENYDPIEFRKVEEKKLITPTNRKPLALKDKTNRENKISPQSTLVKRTISKTAAWRKSVLSKTPELSAITAIINTEENEDIKVKKIRQLFI